MATIGIPWFILVRYLGPPLFLLAVGGFLLLRWPPRRRGLAWAALATNLGAAALPFLWIAVQQITGAGDLTLVGLIMTLLQPGLVVLAWLILLWALVDPRQRKQTRPQTQAQAQAQAQRQDTVSTREREQSAGNVG